MKRFAIVVVAALIGIAAPARAWCEASCLAASHHTESTAKPHCPAHESSDGGPSLSAGDLDDCPLVEAARPTTPKVDIARTTRTITWYPARPQVRADAPRHSSTQAPSHLNNSPLRI